MAGLAVMQYQFNGVTQIEAWEGIKVIPFKGTMENTKIYRNGKVTEWNGQVEVSPGDCVSVDYETGEIINMNQIVTFKDPQGRFLLKDILRQPVEEVQTMLTLARFNGARLPSSAANRA